MGRNAGRRVVTILFAAALLTPGALVEGAGAVPASERVDVIVRMARPLDDAALAAVTAHVGGIEVGHRYPSIDGFAARLPAAAVDALARRPDVADVEMDVPVRAAMDVARTSTGTDDAVTDFGLDGNADGQPTYSKDDMVIAVADTGIDDGHEQLDGGKVIEFLDYTTGGCSTPPVEVPAYDDHGHGTHVASIAAGDGDGGAAAATNRGVAPGAALVGLKVLDEDGSGSGCDVRAAIQWTIDHRVEHGIDVLNLSLGTGTSGNGNDSISALVDNAADAGIVVVVAAGNEGPGAGTVEIPGVARNAVTVGAASDRAWPDPPTLAGFSSRGPTTDGRLKPDLVTPGVSVVAAAANLDPDDYVAESGTSMATPVVSGVAALTRETGLPAKDVKGVLECTAVDKGAAGKDNGWGSGTLDAHAAVQAALAGGSTGPGSVAVSETSGNTSVVEGGRTDTYRVRLGRVPCARVTVRMTASSQLKVSPSKLVFTADNWNTKQTVSVRAVDDLRRELERTATIRHTVTSRDDAFDEIAVAKVTVDVGDDDPSGAGYLVLDDRGTIHDFGVARDRGDAPRSVDVVAVEPVKGGNGYLVFDTRGRAYGFGAAKGMGTTRKRSSRHPVADAAVIDDGAGYFLFASTGKVFEIGTARNRVDPVDVPSRRRIVAGEVIDGGDGYFLFASNGRVYAAGTAKGKVPRRDFSRRPDIVGASVVGNGTGYFLFDRSGRVYGAGSARRQVRDTRPKGYEIVDGAARRDGRGYVQVASTGKVFRYGIKASGSPREDLRDAGTAAVAVALL
jgi:serine protease AprX